MEEKLRICRYSLMLFFFCIFVQSLIANVVIAQGTTRSADLTAEQYKQCGVLVYNAHSLFENPQDKMGTIVNSGKLFGKWHILSGITKTAAVKEVKQLIHNSFKEFDSKEKFEARYSKEEQEFCASILKEEFEKNKAKAK